MSTSEARMKKIKYERSMKKQNSERLDKYRVDNRVLKWPEYIKFKFKFYDTSTDPKNNHQILLLVWQVTKHLAILNDV